MWEPYNVADSWTQPHLWQSHCQMLLNRCFFLTFKCFEHALKASILVLFTTEYFLSVESFYTDFSFLFFLQTVQENWTLAFTEELSKVLKVFSIDKKTNYCMNQRQNNCYFMWPSSTDIVSNAHLLFLFFL